MVELYKMLFFGFNAKLYISLKISVNVRPLYLKKTIAIIGTATNMQIYPVALIPIASFNKKNKGITIAKAIKTHMICFPVSPKKIFPSYSVISLWTFASNIKSPFLCCRCYF